MWQAGGTLMQVVGHGECERNREENSRYRNVAWGRQWVKVAAGHVVVGYTLSRPGTMVG